MPRSDCSALHEKNPNLKQKTKKTFIENDFSSKNAFNSFQSDITVQYYFKTSENQRLSRLYKGFIVQEWDRL